MEERASKPSRLHNHTLPYSATMIEHEIHRYVHAFTSPARISTPPTAPTPLHPCRNASRAPSNSSVDPPLHTLHPAPRAVQVDPHSTPTRANASFRQHAKSNRLCDTLWRVPVRDTKTPQVDRVGDTPVQGSLCGLPLPIQRGERRSLARMEWY